MIHYLITLIENLIIVCIALPIIATIFFIMIYIAFRCFYNVDFFVKYLQGRNE